MTFTEAPTGGASLHDLAAKTITGIAVGVDLDLEADEFDWYCTHLAHHLREQFKNARVDVGFGTYLSVVHDGPPRLTVMGDSMQHEVVKLAIERTFTNCQWDMK